MRANRFASTALMVVASLTLLSACEGNVFLGPIAIKRDGVKLLVAVCSAVSVSEVTGDQRYAGMFEHWQSFWTANGKVDVASGDILSTGSTIEGLNSTLAKSPRMDAGDAIDIGISSSDQGNSTYLHAVFQIRDAKLSQSVWLHPDGTTTKEACAN